MISLLCLVGGTMDFLNFFYAAHTYVDEWIEFDKGPGAVRRAGLRTNDGGGEAHGIIRNFKTEEDGCVRLSPVWTALQAIKVPVSDQDAKDCVAELVKALKPTYHHDLWSAASKFLWVRFGEPIIIYDTLAWNWMCKHGSCPAEGSYADYCDAWRKMFRTHEEEIARACEELRQVRRFLCADGVSEAEYEQAVSSRWFAERVFDHAIINGKAVA